MISVLNFIRKASKVNIFLFLGIAFILMLLSSVIISFFSSPLGASNGSVNYIEHSGKVVTVLLVVIWTPVFETFLYQALITHIIRAFVHKIRYSFVISILISSLAFGLSHPYSLPYVLAATLYGIILAATYYIFLYRKQSAFLVVFLLHALINVSALLPFLQK